MFTAYNCRLNDHIEFSCDDQQNLATITICRSELASILKAWKEVKENGSGLTLQVNSQGNLTDLHIPDLVMNLLVHLSALAVIKAQAEA